MADRIKRAEEQKERKDLKNEISFLNEIKSIFHDFLRAIIWWKENEKMKYISFKSYKVRILYQGG